MTSENRSPRRSGFRVVLNCCAIIWFLVCTLLLCCAVGLGGFSIFGLLTHQVQADGQPIDPQLLREGVYLAVACALVDAAIIMYGRKYFRRCYERIAELEQLERRGPLRS